MFTGRKGDFVVKNTFSEYLAEYRHMTPHFTSFSFYVKISNFEDYWKNSVKRVVLGARRGKIRGQYH